MSVDNTKTRGERLRETLAIVRDMDFMRRCPEYTQFRDVVNAYVRHGVSASGEIEFKGAKRVLTYVLTTRADRECAACLKCTDDARDE